MSKSWNQYKVRSLGLVDWVKIEFVQYSRWLKGLALTFALLIAFPFPSSAEEPAEAIRQVMKATWDKPDNHLTVDPIVVSGDHAVADWSQGAMGGRALLRRKEGHWLVWLCSGDSLKDAMTLHMTGIPLDVASGLAKALGAEEAKLPAERLAVFARFEGTVMVQGDDSAHHHHATETPPK